MEKRNDNWIRNDFFFQFILRKRKKKAQKVVFILKLYHTLIQTTTLDSLSEFFSKFNFDIKTSYLENSFRNCEGLKFLTPNDIFFNCCKMD